MFENIQFGRAVEDGLINLPISRSTAPLYTGRNESRRISLVLDAHLLAEWKHQFPQTLLERSHTSKLLSKEYLLSMKHLVKIFILRLEWHNNILMKCQNGTNYIRHDLGNLPTNPPQC